MYSKNVDHALNIVMDDDIDRSIEMNAVSMRKIRNNQTTDDHSRYLQNERKIQKHGVEKQQWEWQIHADFFLGIVQAKLPEQFDVRRDMSEQLDVRRDISEQLE